jgi:hypothetical protein
MERRPSRLANECVKAFVVRGFEVRRRCPLRNVNEAKGGVGRERPMHSVPQIAWLRLHVCIDLLPEAEELVLPAGWNLETVDKSYDRH